MHQRRIPLRAGNWPLVGCQPLVQASTVVLDYRKTKLPRVLETIQREAAHHGVAIAGAELIGSVPIEWR